MRLSKRIRREIVFRLVSALFWLLNIIPRSLALYVGAWGGVITWRLLKTDRFKFHRHLAIVYGDRLTPPERQKLSRDYFVNAGKNFTDVLRFRKHYESELKPQITVEGLEHFDAALKQGKGLLGITGHLGNFELLAVHFAGLGYPIAAIGRDLYEPRINRLLIDNRTATGVTNFSTKESPKRMIKWLRGGGALGVLIDTDSHRVRGEFVPAFGRWSYTPVGQTVLGLKTGAAFVPMACVRRADNGYHMIVKPEIRLESTGDFDRDVYEMTAACTRAVEALIREYPDQWCWQHNKWRTRRQSA